jgi:DNA-binding response OmpR family regulator
MVWRISPFWFRQTRHVRWRQIAARSAAQEEGDHMNGTVLIVDEDVNAQIIAETLLRLRGLDVQIARDSAEAGEILARQDVCVMVVDINGSSMNGFEGLHRLCVVAETLPIQPRLAVITDRCEPELELFAQRLGVNAVLRKPMNPGQFISTVEGLMDSAAPRAA